MLDIETKNKIVNHFGLDPNSDYPAPNIEIEDCIKFMKDEYGHIVDIYHNESLEELFIKNELTIPQNVMLEDLSILLNDLEKCYVKITEEKNIAFDNFMDMEFMSCRSKGDELVSKPDTVSAVLAPIHKAIFRANNNLVLQPFTRVLDRASLYKYDNFKALKAIGAGNHRIYGCMLFAPLLKGLEIPVRSLNTYRANDYFYQKIELLKKVIGFFSTTGLEVKISFNKDDNPYNIENKKDRLLVSLEIRSEYLNQYNKPKVLLQLFNMSLEDLVESYNENLPEIIASLNLINKEDNYYVYAHKKEKYKIMKEKEFSEHFYTIDEIYKEVIVKPLPLLNKIPIIKNIYEIIRNYIVSLRLFKVLCQ